MLFIGITIYNLNVTSPRGQLT